MSERDFPRKVIDILNHGVDRLDSATARRLGEARRQALARARTAAETRGSHALVWSSWLQHHRIAVAGTMLVALLVCVAGVWQILPQQADDTAQIDAGLLTDDLPVHAYLDNHFTEWLNNTSAQ